MASNTSGYVSDASSQSEVIQDVIARKVMTVVMTAALTLTIYDTTLVFSDELSLIWRRKWRLGTFLYLLARYGTFLQIFLNLLLSVPISTSITLLDPKFAGLDVSLEDVVAPILITRFMLQLRQRQQAQAAPMSLPTVSTAQFNRRPTTGSGIRSALSRISDHVVQEFGEPDMPPNIDNRDFHKEDSQMIQTEKGLSRSQIAMADEYPWACIEYSEMIDD
ncbi:hypothetical protein M422DRAFT_241175 [Sphaerobolus stellatus SS14]|nr:hypothetical protein M422DRAFT_241175 [Sphaerobolus stellatus SS14]